MSFPSNGKSFGSSVLGSLCQYPNHRQAVFRTRSHVRNGSGLRDQSIQRRCFSIGRRKWIGEHAIGVSQQQRARRHGSERESRHAGVVDAAAEAHAGQVDAAPSGNSGERSAERPIWKRDAHARGELSTGQRAEES